MSKPLLHSLGSPEISELDAIEKLIEDKYLKFCDPENPLHFMTIWWTRAYLAKCHLLEHHSRYSGSSLYRTDVQRDAAVSYSLRMLKCDTKLMTSPCGKRFLWLIYFHFPFIAYFQIVQELKKRPCSVHAEDAWDYMKENYEARFVFQDNEYIQGPFFKIFSKLVLQAWAAREAAFIQLGEPLAVPKIVSSIRYRLALAAQTFHFPDTQQPSDAMGIADFPGNSTSNGQIYDIAAHAHFDDVDIDHINWSSMNWGFEGGYSAV
jgi:hypothetical protein